MNNLALIKDFNSNTTNNDEWLTPPFILRELGIFDLDPCSPHPNQRPWNTAKKHFHKEENGLFKKWFGRAWCNPPYGRETFKWLEKLYEHGNGIALIFARTETKGFHEQIWQKANSIFFFKGRLKFYHIDGKQGNCANAPSCLVRYNDENSQILKNSNLLGRFISLKN